MCLLIHWYPVTHLFIHWQYPEMEFVSDDMFYEEQSKQTSEQKKTLLRVDPSPTQMLKGLPLSMEAGADPSCSNVIHYYQLLINYLEDSPCGHL
jgi:hypothetical protein